MLDFIRLGRLCFPFVRQAAKHRWPGGHLLRRRGGATGIAVTPLFRSVPFILAFAALSTLPVTTLAAQEVKEGTPPPIRQAISDSAPRVEIVEDQEVGAFRFMIDGQEIARLDAAGLHVRESIELGGTITDAGTAYFDQYIGQGGGE